MTRFRRSPKHAWLPSTTAVFGLVSASDHLLATATVPLQDAWTPANAINDGISFGYEGVLGTSLDVILGETNSADAAECERQILAEIDRLENILNARLPSSEVSRVKAGATVESKDLAAVLEAYATWSDRSGGALCSHLGEVISLWRQAPETDCLPNAAMLAAAFAKPLALDLDALGKGYVVDAVVDVARRFVRSGIVNIGGDLRAWGDRNWFVGIANPHDFADNSAPLLHFPLRDAAVATSGGYQRYFTIDGRRYSHLIDPRTLRPEDRGSSATVVAKDCLTANALSTATAIMGPVEGANLARTYAFDYLILGKPVEQPTKDADKKSLRRISGKNLHSTAVSEKTGAIKEWPANYYVAVTLTLKSPEGMKVRRPYVAIWVENEQGKIVRTLSIWGIRHKYLPDLTNWSRAVDYDYSVTQMVSRATRPPGTYTLTWNGLDDQGHLAPAGEYKISVEINRENGHHVCESVSIECGADPVKAAIPATPESESTSIEYGPKSD